MSAAQMKIQMVKPISSRIPIRTIIEFPIATVASLSVGESRSCPKPPTNATIDCQDNEARKVPEMNNTTFSGEPEIFDLRLKISVVK